MRREVQRGPQAGIDFRPARPGRSARGAGNRTAGTGSNGPAGRGVRGGSACRRYGENLREDRRRPGAAQLSQDAPTGRGTGAGAHAAAGDVQGAAQRHPSNGHRTLAGGFREGDRYRACATRECRSRHGRRADSADEGACAYACAGGRQQEAALRAAARGRPAVGRRARVAPREHPTGRRLAVPAARACASADGCNCPSAGAANACRD